MAGAGPHAQQIFPESAGATAPLSRSLCPLGHSAAFLHLCASARSRSYPPSLYPPVPPLCPHCSAGHVSKYSVPGMVGPHALAQLSIQRVALIRLEGAKLKGGGVPPKESQNCRGPLSPSLHTSPCSSPPTPLLPSTPSQGLHCMQRQRRGLWGGVAWRRGPPPSGHSLGCGRAQRKDDLESAGQMLEKGGRGRPFLDPQPTSALPSPISPGVG